MLFLEYQHCVVCRTGKMAEKNIFQCIGGTSKKKKKKALGGKTSEQMQPKPKFKRNFILKLFKD